MVVKQGIMRMRTGMGMELGMEIGIGVGMLVGCGGGRCIDASCVVTLAIH